MSDAPVRVRANTAKRAKAGSRVGHAKSEAVLRAEFDAMMERSSQKLAKLNAKMDELLDRLDNNRLTS